MATSWLQNIKDLGSSLLSTIRQSTVPGQQVPSTGVTFQPGYEKIFNNDTLYNQTLANARNKMASTSASAVPTTSPATNTGTYYPSSPGPASTQNYTPTIETQSPQVNNGGTDYTSVLSNARDIVDKSYNPVKDIYNEEANALPAQYKAEQAALEANKPLIQQRYQSYLDQLAITERQANEDLTQQGVTETGKQVASQAARGLYATAGTSPEEQYISGQVTKAKGRLGEEAISSKKELGINEATALQDVQNKIDALPAAQRGDEFKIREAMAKLSPDVLNTSISLADKIVSNAREALKMQQDIPLKEAQTRKTTAEAAQAEAERKLLEGSDEPGSAISTWANDVKAGNISLASVPDKLQPAVSLKVQQMQAERAKVGVSDTEEAVMKWKAEGYSRDEVWNNYLKAKAAGKTVPSEEEMTQSLDAQYPKGDLWSFINKLAGKYAK